MIRILIRSAAVILAVSYLLGCATNENITRYYLLSPVPPVDLPDQSEMLEKGHTISLRLNQFPAYLDRPQIVTRSTQHQLKLAEYDRWAEPLHDNFSRVLIRNIAALMPGHKILRLPQRQSPLTIDYQIEVDIIRFDIDEFNKGRLNAEWTIRRLNESSTLITQMSDIVVTLEKAGVEATIATLNKAIFQLSNEIARALQQINKNFSSLSLQGTR